MTRLGLVFLFAALCASSAPVATAAQHGSGGRPPRKPVPAPASKPSAPPASSSINLASPATSPFNATPGTFAPRFTSRPRGPRSFGIPLGYGFGTPGFYGDGSANADNSAVSAERAGLGEGEGVLYLDATPRGAQVFVDSAYVGTVDDLFSGGVILTGGRHWLELEAPDYEKKLVEINVTPGLPLRYRADLSPIRRTALVVIPTRPPEAMYAIPGCYGGNKPPVASALPPGCDIKDLRVIKAQRTIN